MAKCKCKCKGLGAVRSGRGRRVGETLPEYVVRFAQENGVEDRINDLISAMSEGLPENADAELQRLYKQVVGSSKPKADSGRHVDTLTFGDGLFYVQIWRDSEGAYHYDGPIDAAPRHIRESGRGPHWMGEVSETHVKEVLRRLIAKGIPHRVKYAEG